MRLISIIIPCYNASAFIETCLDALNSQNADNFEVILIDDCSTDNTVEIIESINKKYSFPVQLIRNEINMGPAFSRKVGAESASCRYLAFCDADDFYSDSFVNSVSNVLCQSSPDMIIFGYNMVFKKRGTVPNKFVRSDCYTDNKEQLFLTGLSSLCCLTIKKELFLSVEHPDLRNGEDMAVIPLLIANAKDAYLVSEPLYNYVSRVDSASSTSSMRVVDSLLASFDFVRQNMPKEYNEFEEFIGISRVLYGTILNLFKVGYKRGMAMEIKNSFTRDYPQWRFNKYIKKLPITRKIFIWFIGHNLTLIPWFMTKIHTWMIQ